MSSFQKATVAQQVADALRQQIETGEHSRTLPSEHQLCDQFLVSRTTVRQALAALRRDGMLATVKGVGTEIISREVVRPKTAERSIGLLMPTPVGELKPYQVFWIDDLKTLLRKADYELIIHTGKHYLRTTNAGARERLTRQYRHRCWVLNLSNRAIQRYFSDQTIPCVVAGTCVDGVKLPCVELDNYALGRHAAGRFLAAGHRQLAILKEKTVTASWMTCVRGFMDEVSAHRGEAAQCKVLEHEPTVEAAFRLLMRTFTGGSRPPTGLIVINPFYYLTVTSFLTQRHLRVPEDVSLITTYGDPFLKYVVPAPCRYDCQPVQYARALTRMILSMAEGGGNVRASRQQLLPEYMSGASVRSPANPA
ncbi:MAG: transcriptional regulator [Lacunisphaera sp.]|nr:transcriptional regulator [Lacunisphaera sp.]